MSSTEVKPYVFYRPSPEESIESRYVDFVEKMQRIGLPLGFAGLAIPPVPDAGDEYITWVEVKYPIRGLKMAMTYTNRRHRYLTEDVASRDDNVRIRFRTSNKAIDYAAVLQEHFPRVIEAFKGYRSLVSFGYHSVMYDKVEKNKIIYEKLKANPSINIDGRNNIFRLRPANYWDRLLCERALGYGPEEVVRRLEGQVPQVRMLNDGVYTVFNDDKNLSFEDFLAFNDRFKPILGLE